MQMLSRAMKIAEINVDLTSTELSNFNQLKDGDNISAYERQAAAICIKYGLVEENATAIIKLLNKAGLI